MRQRKRILILTSDFGFGHRSTANALQAALKNRYATELQIEINNPFEHKSVPSLLRGNEGEYTRLVREAPELYQLGYQVIDVPITTAIYESGLTLVLYEALTDIVKQAKPDVIVVTHPNYLTPLKMVFRFMDATIPIVTVVTDLGVVQRMWFNSVSRWTLVPTRRVYELALENKLEESSVKITGIPVNPLLADEARTASTIRAELGLVPDRLTVLAVSSKRVSNMREALIVLNHCGMPLQLIVVAGGDDDFYGDMEKIDWHVPVKLYDFVEQMPPLIRAADFVVSKAGGLVVSESLAGGVPLLLIDYIEGQETGNVEFVTESGAGDLATTALDILQTLHHWLMHDGRILQERTKNARRVGRPQAAYDAAHIIYQEARNMIP